MPVTAPLARRFAAELTGTGLLLATVVGSGIMADRLADGNVAVALLANALATGAGLVVYITVFGPISGAHFNPVVTLVEAARGRAAPGEVAAYVGAQTAGAIGGVVLAHAMFGLPLLQVSGHARADAGQWISEAVATFGLLLTILGSAKRSSEHVAVLVALYVVAAYWFTASTSFANPAVTLARALTDTFAGIRPDDVPGFVGAQLVGAALAAGAWRLFDPPPELP